MSGGLPGAVKFAFFGDHVVLGKISSPGSEGHPRRTCLLRGGEMSRRCSGGGRGQGLGWGLQGPR